MSGIEDLTSWYALGASLGASCLVGEGLRNQIARTYGEITGRYVNILLDVAKLLAVVPVGIVLNEVIQSSENAWYVGLLVGLVLSLPIHGGVGLVRDLAPLFHEGQN